MIFLNPHAILPDIINYTTIPDKTAMQKGTVTDMKLPIINTKGTGVIKIAIKRTEGDIILLYRLTKELPCDSLSRFQYSLTVTKVDNGGSRREVRRIADISRSKTEAERLFDLISRACVMPGTAEEVISDLISI